MPSVKPLRQKLLCHGDHGTVYIMQSTCSLYQSISFTLTHTLTDKSCPVDSWSDATNSYFESSGMSPFCILRQILWGQVWRATSGLEVQFFYIPAKLFLFVYLWLPIWVIVHIGMYVCMLVLAPAWVAWSLGRSPVFLRPLADAAFLKTAGQGVAEHLDEAEAQCGCHWETSMGSLHYPEQDLLHPSVFLRVFGSILSSVQSLCTW